MKPAIRRCQNTGSGQDFLTMTTVLSRKGQIVLPAAVRDQLHLEEGQDFEVFVDDDDTITLSWRLREGWPPRHRPARTASRAGDEPHRSFPSWRVVPDIVPWPERP